MGADSSSIHVHTNASVSANIFNNPDSITSQIDVEQVLEEKYVIDQTPQTNAKNEIQVTNQIEQTQQMVFPFDKLEELKLTALLSTGITYSSSNETNVLSKPMVDGVLSRPFLTNSNSNQLKQELKNIKPYQTKTSDAQMKKVSKTLSKTNQISDIAEIFIFKKIFGKGGSCRVLLCEHHKSKKLYALKELSIEQEHNPILFLTEANILKSLQKCKNIITFFDAYVDSTHLYIATEYLSGGTLLSRISETKLFTEKIAVKAIKTILKTVKFIHSKKIYHRDLKPANLVYNKPGPDGVLTLIDFGDATMVDDHEYDNTYVGTLPFFTPEMIHSRKRTGVMIRKGDMWCIGVISFIVLTGMYPWMHANAKRLPRRIRKDPLVWPKHVDLSDECKDFIGKLLNKKWKARPEADAALKHEWICSGKARDRDLGKQFKNCIMEAQKMNKLERIILNAITSKMTADECHLLMDELLKFNKNDKKLNEQNLVEFLILHHVNAETAKQQCKDIFEHACSDSKEKEIDLNNEDLLNGVINGICHDENIDSLALGALTEMESNDEKIETRDSVISTKQFNILILDINAKYNMDQVISNLDPKKTGFIDLKNLCKYNQSIGSVDQYLFD